MATSQPSSDSLSPEARQFATTHWSVVLTAGQDKLPGATEALERLCRTYWYPLYAYVRRQGSEPHDAQDLTQAFFARFLEKNYLDDVDRSKGKFRSFLLASLKHFLANEWDRMRAQKRGGGRVLVALDDHTAEERYRLEPKDELTPERVFERRWALTLLDQVLSRLREEFETQGKGPQFEHLKVCLSGERDTLPYSRLAVQLHMSEGAVKVAVHRMRQRYRQLLRAEISHTVANAAEIEEEIRCLFAALSR